MKYLVKTFQYLKRSAWLLVLIALVPAFVMAVFFKPIGIISFFPEYCIHDVRSFADIFWMLASREGRPIIWPFFVVAALLFVFYALILAVIEKHLKTGALNGKNLLISLNNNFIPALFSLIFIALVLIVAVVLQASLLTLLHSIVSGAGRATVLDCFYAAVVALLIFAGVMVAVLPMMYWGPVMQIFGYKFNDSVVETAHLIGKKLFNLILGLALPLLAAGILSLALNTIPIKGAGKVIANLLIDTVIHIFVLIYTASYVMVSVFDITGLERRDSKRYAWR